MCVISSLTLAGIGSAIAAGVSSAASAVGTAAAAVGSGLAAAGSGIASGASALGGMAMSGLSAAGSGLASAASAAASGVSSLGSAVASGASSIGSAVASGASSVGSTVAEGAVAAYNGVTGAVTGIGEGVAGAESYVVGAASEAGNVGLTAPAVGSTEVGAVTLNSGAEASMLMDMANAGIPLTANNTAMAAKGAIDANAGTFLGTTAAAAGTAAPFLSTAGTLAKVGAMGLGVYNGISGYYGARDAARDQKELLEQDARNQREIAAKNLELAGAAAALQAQEGAIEAEAADLHRIRAGVLGQEGDYKSEGVLKETRTKKSQARVAAAGRGVLLEGRAEAAPSIAEQDATAEAVWSVNRIKDQVGMQQDLLMRQRSIGLKRAALTKARAGLTAMRGQIDYEKSMLDADYKDAQARAAYKQGNLTATSNLISGLTQAGVAGLSLFA